MSDCTRRSTEVRSIRARKRWGQHFLTSVSAAQRIVELLGATAEEMVLEIGAGTGSLTQFLLPCCRELVAVEIDPRCIEHLRERFPAEQFPQLRLVHQDVLEFDLESLAREALERTGRKLLVVGNLPYNISSPLLFRLFAHARWLGRAVIMLQREVALRLVASPGTPEYGIPTVACWAVARARMHFQLSPRMFSPPPAVVSAVVSLEFLEDGWTGAEYEGFLAFLHAAFGQRRKQLRNALRHWLEQHCGSWRQGEELLAHAGIPLDRRAEQLAPHELARIYRTVTEGKPVGTR
mgnify:FL=1